MTDEELDWLIAGGLEKMEQEGKRDTYRIRSDIRRRCSVVASTRAAEWPITYSDGLADVNWQKEVEHSVRVAKAMQTSHLSISEFNSLTRSVTPFAPPSSCNELTTIALALLERVQLGPQ